MVRASTVEWPLALWRQFGIQKRRRSSTLSASFRWPRQQSTYVEARNRAGQTKNSESDRCRLYPSQTEWRASSTVYIHLQRLWTATALGWPSLPSRREKMPHLRKANHFAPRCPEKSSKPQTSSSSIGSRQENGANANNHGNKTDEGNSQKSKMARIQIGNVKATHRDRRTPTISAELLDSNGTPTRSYDNVTQDPRVEVSVGGVDFLSAIGLTD